MAVSFRFLLVVSADLGSVSSLVSSFGVCFSALILILGSGVLTGGLAALEVLFGVLESALGALDVEASEEALDDLFGVFVSVFNNNL